jgi:hypothetical protein
VTTSPVMRLLAEGVPITLLCDLVSSGDPQSQTISLSERPPLDLSDPLSATALCGPDNAPQWRAVSAG